MLYNYGTAVKFKVLKKEKKIYINVKYLLIILKHLIIKIVIKTIQLLIQSLSMGKKIHGRLYGSPPPPPKLLAKFHFKTSLQKL